ncbi:MAG: hypothetical protein M1833_005541 [Piccolia ochrophora]|nr:MAG: hypothetical protein M1833_005541 [Piccolia ochrophora]
MASASPLPQPVILPISNAVEQPFQWLFDSLKGQSASVPDLYQIFPNVPIPEARHDYHLVREVVDTWLSRFVEDNAIRAKLQAADFAKFANLWYGGISLDRCQTIAAYGAWLGAFDDEMEEYALSGDRVAASQTAEEAILVFEYCFGQSAFYGARPQPRSLVMQGFIDIGDQFRRGLSQASRKRFLTELRDFTFAVAQTQNIRERGSLLDFNSYIARRYHVSAVRTALAMLDFAYGYSIPECTFEDEAFIDIWQRTSFILAMTNDIISLQKEFNAGEIDNGILVLIYHHQSNLQTAIDVAVQLCHDNYEALLDAECYLKTGPEEMHPDVFDFVDRCKGFCLNTVHWSYINGRYIKPGALDANRRLLIQL